MTTPTDVLMYDFQTIRYSSPMIDVIILLLVSASHDLRGKHFNELFKLYYDTMIESYCAKSGPVVPDFMTFDAFLLELYKMFPYGLMISSSFLPVLVEPPVRGFS